MFRTLLRVCVAVLGGALVLAVLIMVGWELGRRAFFRLGRHACPACQVRSRAHAVRVLGLDDAAREGFDAELTCSSCGHVWRRGHGGI